MRQRQISFSNRTLLSEYNGTEHRYFTVLIITKLRKLELERNCKIKSQL
jgi:hypothetical protein